MSEPHSKTPPGSLSNLPKISVLWLAIPIALLAFTFFWKPDSKSTSTELTTANKAAADDSTPEFSYITHKKEDYRPFIHDIREAIRNTVKDETRTGNTTEVSVNFELLDKGISYTYGYTDWFWPASLLKITTLIAYLRQAENDSAFLNTKVAYHHTNLGYSQNFVKDSLKEGNKYSYKQLLERLIVNSDNQACFLLEKTIGEEKINQIYRDFTIDVGRGRKMQDFMPINQYMAILRTLYNATYLTKKYSEYALGLLTRSDFEFGIRAGIPAGIKVASKFGEKADRNDFQLHDCGIVYFDHSPYMIGVMTKGKDYNKMAQTIQHISANIYEIAQSYSKSTQQGGM